MNRITAEATVLIVIIAALAHAQEQPKPAPSAAFTEVKRAIEKGNAQWVEAWEKGDPSLTASLFAEDGVQLAGKGKLIKGRQQIFERQKASMKSTGKGVKVTVTTMDVWLDGDTAYETGRYVYKYQENGKPVTEEGRYVTIWKQQADGSWKLTMDMGIPNE